MKVFIWGGAGFLGSEIAKLLTTAGYEVVVLTREQTDTSRLDSIKSAANFQLISGSIQESFAKSALATADVIINAAVNYGIAKSSNKDEIYFTNFHAPLALFNSANLGKAFLFINCGSAFNKQSGVVGNISDYADSKSLLERELTSNSSSLRSITLRFEYLYGPNDLKHKFSTQCIDQIAFAKNFEFLMSNGEQVRDFIHVEDAAHAILKTIILESNYESGGSFIFSVGSEVPTTLYDFALTVKKAANSDTTIVRGKVPRKSYEILNSVADSSFSNRYNFRPKYLLSEGIKKIINS